MKYADRIEEILRGRNRREWMVINWVGMQMSSIRTEKLLTSSHKNFKPTSIIHF